MAGFKGDAGGVERRESDSGESPPTCSDAAERSARSNLLGRLSIPLAALYRCAPDKLEVEALALARLPTSAPASSPSSVISSRRPTEGEGDAVCSWKVLARAVSLSASPVVISSSVS